MNDLIISIAKERILPISSNFIDYPNEQFEAQLYRLSIYITKAILDAYTVISNWPFVITEQSILTLALKTIFPIDWLEVADQSPSVHLNLEKTINQYVHLKLNSSSTERIHKVVEFLCYELIETTVIYSNFQKLTELNVRNLQIGIDGDPVLKRIITQNNIYVTDDIQLKNTMLEITGIEISNKASRMLRVYVEELVKGVLEGRQNFDVLLIEDLERYFR